MDFHRGGAEDGDGMTWATGETTQCGQCGRTHSLTEAQVGFRKPDALLEIPEEQWEQRCWGADSDDMCAIDGRRGFVRGWLPIPVAGREQPFGWGVWFEVSSKDLRTYWERFRDPEQGTLPPILGAIANRIVSYPETTIGVTVSAQLMDENSRPVLTVLDQRHAIFNEQADGVSEQRVASFLHDYFGEADRNM